MLTAEKVLIPSAYAALNQPKNCRHKNVAAPCRWSATTVGYILDRQEFVVFIIPHIAEWLIIRIAVINYGLRDFIKS